MHSSTPTDRVVHDIVIDAPAERIFEALTSPSERVKWWGGEGRFQATHMESDLRPGGHWTMAGNGMNGKPFTITGEYREVTRPRTVAFTWLPSWQEDASETLVRVDLDEQDGTTMVRLTHSGLANDSARNSHRGWPEILAWLKAYVTAGRQS